MTREESLITCQSLLLAAMIRNGIAISNFIGHLRGINERPFLNRQEIKRLKNRIEREFINFENDVRSVLVSYVPTMSSEDIYEALLDAQVEFNKPVRQDLDAYANAIEHLLLKQGIKEHRWLAQLTTAVHFTGLCAYIQGAEFVSCPLLPLRKMLKLGGQVQEISTYNRIAQKQTPPCVMGHFSQMGKRILDMVIRKYGHNPDYEYESEDPHDPIIRAIEMHSDMLIQTLMDYGVIRALFSKLDCTIEEANRLADEEDERIKKSKTKK